MNRFLVDTHALLWFMAGDARCSKAAAGAIRTPRAERLVSVASVWELAIKANGGRLELPEDQIELIEADGFSYLGISPEHAWSNRLLPSRRDHKDPFDRMIAAQALSEGIPVISADPSFDSYGVERIW